jgi:hypothetical protein
VASCPENLYIEYNKQLALFSRFMIAGKSNRTGHTIHVACFGGFSSEGGSHVAGRRSFGWWEAAVGERLVLAAPSMLTARRTGGDVGMVLRLA